MNFLIKIKICNSLFLSSFLQCCISPFHMALLSFIRQQPYFSFSRNGTTLYFSAISAFLLHLFVFLPFFSFSTLNEHNFSNPKSSAKIL